MQCNFGNSGNSGIASFLTMMICETCKFPNIYVHNVKTEGTMPTNSSGRSFDDLESSIRINTYYPRTVFHCRKKLILH